MRVIAHRRYEHIERNRKSKNGSIKTRQQPECDAHEILRRCFERGSIQRRLSGAAKRNNSFVSPRAKTAQASLELAIEQRVTHKEERHETRVGD